MKSRRRIALPTAYDHANSAADYSRDLRSAKGVQGQFAQQQSKTAHVRFGSEADISLSLANVRFTPESGH
jgi:hypothetical protein